ncbi:MAG TPA: hypothetical protein VID25_03750 [Candidatus Limnocylindrales bacterium]
MRMRRLGGIAGLVVAAVAIGACGSSPQSSPTSTAVSGGTPAVASQAAACGSLTQIVWAAPLARVATLADARVVDVVATGRTLIQVPGFPVVSSGVPGDLTTADIDRLVGDFQTYHEQPVVVGNGSAPVLTDFVDWTTRHPPGRYVMFAGGIPVAAPFTARCGTSGAPVAATLLLWSQSEQGLIQCSLSPTEDALAVLARHYCSVDL